MPACGEIAHAAPRLAFLAALDLIVPGKFLGLGLQKPIRHRHPSALSGRVKSDSIAASTLIFSSSRRHDGRRDRHVDGAFARHVEQHRRGEGAFREARRLLDRRRIMAAAEIDAEGEIARLRRRAGEQEIAKPGQAHHGFRLGAVGFAETHKFGKAARGQRGKRAGAEPATGNDAGGDGQHVLGRAADLYSAHVARMIGPERCRADGLRQCGGKLAVGRRQRHRRRQAARHIGGKARARQNRRRRSRGGIPRSPRS